MKKLTVLLLILIVLACGTASAFSFFGDDKAIFNNDNLLTGHAVVEMLDAGNYTWTDWLDRSNPGGDGDYELITDFKEKGLLPCDPVAIECATLDGVDFEDAGENYNCDLRFGGVCINNKQLDGKCLDYKVRFGCRVNGTTDDSDDDPVASAIDIVATGYDLILEGDKALFFLELDEQGLTASDEYDAHVFIGFEELVFVDDSDDFDRDDLVDAPVLTLSFVDLETSWIKTFFVLSALDSGLAIDEVDENNNCVRQEFKVIRNRNDIANVVAVGKPVVGCAEDIEFIDLSEEELEARYSGCDGCSFAGTCISLGDRAGHEYCSLDGLIAQKDIGVACVEDFECGSNICFDAACAKKDDLFHKVVLKVKHLLFRW